MNSLPVPLSPYEEPSCPTVRPAPQSPALPPSRRSGNELLRGSKTGYAFAQKIQFAFASLHVALAAIDIWNPAVDSLTKAFDLGPRSGALKVEPKRLKGVAPALSVLTNDRALSPPVRGTSFAKVDLPTPGRRSRNRSRSEGPADGRLAFT